MATPENQTLVEVQEPSIIVDNATTVRTTPTPTGDETSTTSTATATTTPTTPTTTPTTPTTTPTAGTTSTNSGGFFANLFGTSSSSKSLIKPNCHQCNSAFDGYIFSGTRVVCPVCINEFCTKCCANSIALPHDKFPLQPPRSLLCLACYQKLLTERINELETSSSRLVETPVDPTFTKSFQLSQYLPSWLSSTEAESRSDIICLEIEIPVNETDKIQSRVYTPFSYISAARTGKKTKPPVILFFHGQDFFNGSAKHYNQDYLCFQLSKKTNCVVIAPEYRTAPNHFPLAFEDCYAVFEWVSLNPYQFTTPVDANKIAVVGFGAGATIATALCIMAAQRKCASRPIYQALIDPFTDGVNCTTRDSWKAHPTEAQSLLTQLQNYCPVSDIREDPRLSPALAPSLAGLPPCEMMLAKQSPLFDDGFSYFNKLKEANNNVQCTIFSNAELYFFPYGNEGAEALDQLCLSLEKRLGLEVQLPATTQDLFDFGNPVGTSV